MPSLAAPMLTATSYTRSNGTGMGACVLASTVYCTLYVGRLTNPWDCSRSPIMLSNHLAFLHCAINTPHPIVCYLEVNSYCVVHFVQQMLFVITEFRGFCCGEVH